MARQEFLASFAADIDAGGVSRLQSVPEENRDLANEAAAGHCGADPGEKGETKSGLQMQSGRDSLYDHFMMTDFASSASRTEALLTASADSAGFPISRTATACRLVSTPSFSQIWSCFSPFRDMVGEETYSRTGKCEQHR